MGRTVALGEAVDHEGDAGDVVVGRADEAEETLNRILPQHPQPCSTLKCQGVV